MDKKYFLNSRWKFKAYGRGDELKEVIPKLKSWQNAVIPGTIHTDILNAEIIQDPFYADNESTLQWISKCNWIYSTKFDIPLGFSNEHKTTLVFEGLDTIADIYLNDKLILKSENMFIKYDVEVSDILKRKSNILKIIFYSPVESAKKLEEKYGKLQVELESSRVYLRKAQYSFGWDWGPVFPTMGIWKSVYLEQKDDITINDIVFRTIALLPNKAELECDFKIKQSGRKSYSAIIELYDDEQLVKTIEAKVFGNTSNVRFELDNPKLWWPNGYGKQNIYNLSIKLFNKNELAVEKRVKVGIRTVELIQKENGANTFKFKINNETIFINGVNWIPADSFLPRTNKDKINKLLLLAKNANVNMVRVWGGGIYESNDFFEICDSLGLLVWQDFPFACAVYPTEKWFLSSIKNEVAQNIHRLCNHPALVLWCGNNENEWIWYRQYSKDIREMPDYKIYHELLPELINDINPSQAYWPSSPFGIDDDPNSEFSGNKHQWDIWSFWNDYNEVKNDSSLFVTEFGFQAPANISTFEKVIPKKSRTSQSKLFEFHNKQIEGPERLFKFLSAHLPVKTDWEDFIYLTQLNQGLALKKMIEHWRTNSITNGCVIWQLNDCWTVSSWSIIDSDLKPKLAYYFVKSSFQNELLYFVKSTDKIALKLMSNKLGREPRTIKIYLWDYKRNKGSNINCDNISYTNYNIISFDNNKMENKIIVCSLYDNNKVLLYRTAYVNDEWKYISLTPSKLKVKVINQNNQQFIELSSAVPEFFIQLTHPKLTFNDNGVILLPNEKRLVKIEGGKKVNAKNVKYYCLNNYC